MLAIVNMPLPRLPQAFARQQEALPLTPVQKNPPAQVLGKVISLKAMCAKWWLERVQMLIKRDTSKPQIFALQRFLLDLPREVRSYIVHNGLKAGGLHLSHGSKEIPSVNKVLVFLSSDILICETIYTTIPKPGADETDWPPDLELLIRQGEGATKLVLTLPVYMCNSVKRLLNDICRTCRTLTHVVLHRACDDALAVITRHCRKLQKLDVSGSEDVTDEGVSRAIVNLRWVGDSAPAIKYFDVGNTSVTQDSIMQLLTRLPCITSFGSVDIVEALEGINSLSDGESIVTSIEETTLKCATINRIKSLRNFCPKLNSLTVIFQESPGATLNDLRLLKGLIHLNITVREPFLLAPAHLHDLVWAFQSRLQTLKVSGDVFWEADLGALAGQCPYIRHLALPAITLPTKESLTILQAKGTPTLTYLTELELDCMSGVGPKAWAKDFNLVRKGLVVSLKRCPLLRRFVLRPTCLVDFDIMEILSENRLEKLEVLELYNSTLGLPCATLIIDTCFNLHVMKGLRTWRGLSFVDLILLRKHARGHRRAADLKIVP